MDSGPRPGCRDNGLQADRYVALADLDPRVADALLTALRSAGIAAYAAPPSDRDPLTRVAPPPALRDRVFVDAEARDTARKVLDQEDPAAGRALDEEAAWEAIVAGFAEPAPAERSWPAAEDTAPEPPRTWTPPADPEEEHFVPPPPPPLPRLQPVTLLATLAIVGGLLLFALPSLFTGGPVDDSTALLAVAMVVGGVGTLVYRMHGGGSDDDDPGGGAVV